MVQVDKNVNKILKIEIVFECCTMQRQVDSVSWIAVTYMAAVLFILRKWQAFFYRLLRVAADSATAVLPIQLAKHESRQWHRTQEARSDG